MGTEGEIFRTDLSTMYGSQPIVEQPSFQEKSPEMIVEEHMKKIGELATEAVISAFDYGFFKKILESYVVLESGLIHFELDQETIRKVGTYTFIEPLKKVANFISIHSVNRSTQSARDMALLQSNGKFNEMEISILRAMADQIAKGKQLESFQPKFQTLWLSAHGEA